MWFIAIAAIVIGMMGLRAVEKKEKKLGILARDGSATYIGGFSNIVGGKKAIIGVKEDFILISIGSLADGNTKTLPIDMIINAEIKTETQITRDVGLGKMAVFGVLAFAMKKDKNLVKSYLVIKCKDKEEETNLIFDSVASEKIVNEIRKLKNIKSAF